MRLKEMKKLSHLADDDKDQENPKETENQESLEDQNN